MAITVLLYLACFGLISPPVSSSGNQNLKHEFSDPSHPLLPTSSQNDDPETSPHPYFPSQGVTENSNEKIYDPIPTYRFSPKEAHSMIVDPNPDLVEDKIVDVMTDNGKIHSRGVVGEWRTLSVTVPGDPNSNRALPLGLGKPCSCSGTITPNETLPCLFPDLKRILRHEKRTFLAHRSRRRRSFPKLSAEYSKKGMEPQYFVTNHYLQFFAQVVWPCFGEERIGSWGEGGKWVCRPELLTNSSVVYSIGSFEEVSFEQDIYALTGAKTFTFDPSLNSTQDEHMDKMSFLQFFKLGLTGFKEHKRLRNITTLMAQLGHRYIDVLKVDCEGCEHSFLKDLVENSMVLFAPGVRPLFGQLLVEFHDLPYAMTLSPSLAILESLGYLLFHIEPNYQCETCIELAYIHSSLVSPYE